MLPSPDPRAWIDVDCNALADNYRAVARRADGRHVIASVKGNGYGLGAVETAAIFAGLGAWAVATGSLADALAIRAADPDVRIHMFPAGLPEDIPFFLQQRLIPSLCNMPTAEAVSRAASEPAPVFIKVDSGLGRLGVPIGEAVEFVRAVADLPYVRVEGLFTHLPFSDRAGMDKWLPGLAAFDALVAELEAGGLEIPITQSLASAGVVCGLATRTNAVCAGHLLYGGLSRVTPDLDDLSGFRPALSALKARLIHVAETPNGRHGVVPLGMHHGYRAPAAGQAAWMMLNGTPAPVKGVSQEYATLDLDGHPDAQIGDTAQAVGLAEAGGPTLEQLAIAWATSPLALLMGFNARVPYVYRDQAADAGKGASWSGPRARPDRRRPARRPR